MAALGKEFNAEAQRKREGGKKVAATVFVDFLRDLYYCYFMLTIEQTVTISDDHRIFLDLPPELPVGRAKVELILTPLADVSQIEKTKPCSNGKIRLSKSAINEMFQSETLLSLTGFLHTDMNADEIRTERLRKHEHTN